MLRTTDVIDPYGFTGEDTEVDRMYLLNPLMAGASLRESQPVCTKQFVCANGAPSTGAGVVWIDLAGQQKL